MTAPKDYFYSSRHSHHLANTAIALSACLGVFAGFLTWIMASYFSIDVPRLLVYPGPDGHCNPAEQGLGNHCFGDYASTRFDSLFSLPSPPEAVYPLASRLFQLPIFLVERWLGYRVGLGVFLVTSLASIAFPVYHALRTQVRTLRVMGTVVLATASLGSIATLDRGNSIGLIVTPLYLLCLEIASRKPRLKVILICLLMVTSFKPQFLLILLLLAPTVTIAQLLLVVAVNAVWILGAQVLLAGGEISAIQNWIQNMVAWSNSLPASANYPTNLSLQKIPELMGVDWPLFSYVVCGLYILAQLSKMYVTRVLVHTNPIVGFLLMMIVFGKISYIYYAVLGVVAMGVLLRLNLYRPDHSKIDRHLWFQLVLTSLIIAPIAIPSEWMPLPQLAELSENLWPLFITLSVFCFLLIDALNALNQSARFVSRRTQLTGRSDSEGSLETE